MTLAQAMNRHAIVLTVGVVLIGVGVRSTDWPMFGAGAIVLLIVAPASMFFAVKVRVPQVSRGNGLPTIIAKPVTPLTLTGIVLLTACLVEFALGLFEMRWMACALSVAAASQASLAYVISAAQRSRRPASGRRPRFGRVERLALSLYAMAALLLAVNVGQL